jgi:hypothetical protein
LIQNDFLGIEITKTSFILVLSTVVLNSLQQQHAISGKPTIPTKASANKYEEDCNITQRTKVAELYFNLENFIITATKIL